MEENILTLYFLKGGNRYFIDEVEVPFSWIEGKVFCGYKIITDFQGTDL